MRPIGFWSISRENLKNVKAQDRIGSSHFTVEQFIGTKGEYTATLILEIFVGVHDSTAASRWGTSSPDVATNSRRSGA